MSSKQPRTHTAESSGSRSLLRDQLFKRSKSLESHIKSSRASSRGPKSTSMMSLKKVYLNNSKTRTNSTESKKSKKREVPRASSVEFFKVDDPYTHDKEVGPQCYKIPHILSKNQVLSNLKNSPSFSFSRETPDFRGARSPGVGSYQPKASASATLKQQPRAAIGKERRFLELNSLSNYKSCTPAQYATGSAQVQ